VTQEQTHDALRHSPTEPEITTATKEHNRNSETKKRPRFPAPQAERSCRKLQKPTVIGCTARGWQTWSQRRWLGLGPKTGWQKEKNKERWREILPGFGAALLARESGRAGWVTHACFSREQTASESPSGGCGSQKKKTLTGEENRLGGSAARMAIAEAGKQKNKQNKNQRRRSLHE
jgi:hypothetical protein